jgi:hypothetical protein
MQGMQNMAGGGIVAFASGDSVPNPDDENIAKVMRLRPELSKEQAAALAAQLPKSGTTIGQQIQSIAAEAEQRRSDPVARVMQADPRLTMDEARIIAQPRGIASLQAEAEGDLGNQGSAIPTTTPAPPVTVADKAAPATQAAPVAPAYSGPMGKGIQSLTNLAPDSVDIDAINRRMSTAYPGMEGIDKQRADAADKLAQLYAKQNDPERLRQEKIHAFLSGLSHGATAASGLGLASEGVAETGKAQDAAKVTQIKELQANVEVRAKELMAMGMERSKAVEKAITDQGQISASNYGTRSQAASAANQTAAYNLNSQRDLQAAEARIKAVDLKTEEDYRKAENVLAAKNLADQSLSPEARSKTLADFDTNFADLIRTKKKQEIANTKGKNAAEAATAEIEAYVSLMRQQYLMERVSGVQQSYGGTAPTPGVNPNDPMAKFYR